MAAFLFITCCNVRLRDSKCRRDERDGMRFVQGSFTGKLSAPMSVLGFGCAPLLGRASRRESLRALGLAMEAGITFYDTARSYGYGESEGLLGEFLAGRRDRVVLCTKFGILPAAGGWKQRVKPLAQAAVKRIPALQKLARRAATGQLQPEQFDVATLRKSFETSLRELRTEYVDLLLLHAAPLSVFERDDLFEALEKLVAQGKVKLAGISGERDVIEHTMASRPAVLQTAQFAVNVDSLGFTRETRRHTLANPQSLLLVANHPFGGPGGVASTRARIAALGTDPALPLSLREKLSAGDRDAPLMPEVVLNTIVNGTGISAVIPAMVSARSIAANVAAIEDCRFNAEELTQLRAALVAAAGGQPAAASGTSA
jgi:aryl-alcohol dehydrogenase-like predicted oxidoreductase